MVLASTRRFPRLSRRLHIGSCIIRTLQVLVLRASLLVLQAEEVPNRGSRVPSLQLLGRTWLALTVYMILLR